MTSETPLSHKNKCKGKKNQQKQAHIDGETSDDAFSIPSSTFNSNTSSSTRTYADLASLPPPPAKRTRNFSPNDMEQDFASSSTPTQNISQKTGYAKSTQHPSKNLTAAAHNLQPNTDSQSGNQPVKVISRNS